MSVETKITITCNKCGKKSTSDNYEQFCSKVNLPSVNHFNNFEIDILRHVDQTDIHAFGINIKIDEKTDLCPECRKWINKFFEEEADRIRVLLEQKWKKK